MTLNGVMAVILRYSSNSGIFRVHCVKVHVRCLISWWVLVVFCTVIGFATHCNQQYIVTNFVHPKVEKEYTKYNNTHKYTISNNSEKKKNEEKLLTEHEMEDQLWQQKYQVN